MGSAWEYRRGKNGTFTHDLARRFQQLDKRSKCAIFIGDSDSFPSVSQPARCSTEGDYRNSKRIRHLLIFSSASALGKVDKVSNQEGFNRNYDSLAAAYFRSGEIEGVKYQNHSFFEIIQILGVFSCCCSKSSINWLSSPARESTQSCTTTSLDFPLIHCLLQFSFSMASQKSAPTICENSSARFLILTNLPGLRRASPLYNDPPESFFRSFQPVRYRSSRQ